MKKALIFGASGFVGSYLLDELLNSSDYEEVTVVVRKELHVEHAKLRVLLGDYHSLNELKQSIIADDIFIALGTTWVKTPDKSSYYQIDHDYPVLAAKIARERGVKSVFVVTAVGANADSNIFYLRTKGETERDIIALNFERTNIFRPSMIMGTRKETRKLERLMIKIWSLINRVLVGKALKKFRGIEAKDIAGAMVNAAKKQEKKIAIYHWQQMHNLV